MAKTQTVATRPPNELAVGQTIYYEDVIEAIEMANYAFGHQTEVLFDLVVDGNNWGSAGSEKGPHGIVFPDDTIQVTRFVFEVWIDPDADVIKVAAEAFFDTGEGGQIDVTIGGASAVTLTWATGASGERTNTVNTSSSGTGRQTVTIELKSNTTGNTTSFLELIRAETQPITSSLPDPQNE